MTLKLNRPKRLQIVNAAIVGLYKETYESIYRSAVVATEKFVKSCSNHDYFITIPKHLLEYVKSESSIYLDKSISTINTIEFISKVSYIVFDDLIYGTDLCRVYDSDIPELVALREITKTIDMAFSELHGVLQSYSSTSKLVCDLPWTQQYIRESGTSTELVDIQTINALNEKFGKLK